MQSDNYRLVNRIIVLVFVVFFCVFAVTCFRGTGACPSLVLYNTPCVLCGCTRDFFGVFKGELGRRNPLSPWLFCILHAEFFWRLVFSFVRCKRVVARTDAVLHLVVAVPLLVYLAAINPLWKEFL